MLRTYPAVRYLIREHQYQIEEHEKNYRINKEIKISRPKIKDRFLLSLGRHLIAVGSKLQNRAKPAFASCSGDYQACCGRV